MARRTKNDAGLTAEDLEAFARMLLDRRQEILGSVMSIEDSVLHRDSKDSSSTPFHLADLGSDTFEIENSLSLVEGERKILWEIFEALDRIENGTYGICLGTGKPIGMERLRAIPWARYCIEFTRLAEQGLTDFDVMGEGGSSENTAA